MLEKYLRYDVVGMLTGLKENKKLLQLWKNQLEGMADNIQAIQYDKEKVSTQPRKDGIDELIIRRDNLRQRIKEYEKDIGIIEGCLNSLDEEESFIVNEFFFKNQSGLSATLNITDEYHYEQSTVYRRRADIVKKIKAMVFGREEE